MDAMLESTANPDEFSRKLTELSKKDGRKNRSMANTFLHRFEDYMDEIPRDRTIDVLSALFLAGDELISVDPSESILDNGSDGPLLRIIWNLVEKPDKNTRHEILSEAIRKGNSAYLPSYFVGVMMQQHGEYGGEEKNEEDRTFTWDQIDILQEVTVNKTEELAASEDLLEAPNLHIILGRWHEWGDGEKVEDWSRRTFADEEKLLALLEGIVQVGRRSSARRYSEIEYINPEDVEPYLDIHL
jgi:predicted KAP-like P-loop ATPase